MSKGDDQTIIIDVASNTIDEFTDAFIPGAPIDLTGSTVTMVIVVDGVEISNLNGVLDTEILGRVSFDLPSADTLSLVGDKTGESEIKIVGALGKIKSRLGPEFSIRETTDLDD